MRDRVKDYHIYATNSQVVVRLLTLPNDVVLEEVEGELTPVSTRRVIEAIRLIVDETIGEVFCSSMQKNKIRKVYGSGTSMGVTAACAIEFAQPEGKTANTTDQFTIELDWGDVTAKETTLNSAKEEILTAVDNIKLPEIDTTELAKQGDDKNATLTAIYKMLVGNDEPTQDIPEGVAERLALILEFFGMKPIDAYEFMTAEEVCSELEEIMTSMDLELTQEMAATITNNTLNEQ